MATHSNVLTWRIPGTVEPGGLPSVGSHRVRHDWSYLVAAAAAFFYVIIKRQSNFKMNSLSRHIFREGMWMAKRHMKRCSKSLITREVQIKSTMRSHSTPTRMAIIKKIMSSVGKDVKKLEHCWWEYKMVQTLWKTIWHFLKVLSVKVSCDPGEMKIYMSTKKLVWEINTTL